MAFDTKFDIVYPVSHCSIYQVLALKTGSSTVVLLKELGLMLELPRILLNMYQVYILLKPACLIVEHFFLGGHCSAIPEHNWKRQSGRVWRQGACSLLSLWRQLSIFLQFCLQVTVYSLFNYIYFFLLPPILMTLPLNLT